MAANCLKVEEEDLKPGAKSNWFGECTDCLLGISELCCWCQSVSQNRGVRRRGHLGCQRLASREGCLFHESRLAKLELREAVRALCVALQTCVCGCARKHEATMSDLPEIDRILNNAQVYGQDLSRQKAVVDESFQETRLGRFSRISRRNVRGRGGGVTAENLGSWQMRR